MVPCNKLLLRLAVLGDIGLIMSDFEVGSLYSINTLFLSQSWFKGCAVIYLIVVLSLLLLLFPLSVKQIMASLKKSPAAGLVSYADLIAMAGAHAVAITGGPKIRVPVGRVDAAAADPPGRMASEMSSADVLKQNFSEKGFNVREMVVLSGAHTIGEG